MKKWNVLLGLILSITLIGCSNQAEDEPANTENQDNLVEETTNNQNENERENQAENNDTAEDEEEEEATNMYAGLSVSEIEAELNLTEAETITVDFWDDFSDYITVYAKELIIYDNNAGYKVTLDIENIADETIDIGASSVAIDASSVDESLYLLEETLASGEEGSFEFIIANMSPDEEIPVVESELDFAITILNPETKEMLDYVSVLIDL